jgi:hypothetical protein
MDLWGERVRPALLASTEKLLPPGSCPPALIGLARGHRGTCRRVLPSPKHSADVSHSGPRRNIHAQTVQFQVQDVTFCKNRLVVPNTALSHLLAQAGSIMLYLDNQKNGQHGAMIHHTACPSWFCPVKALAWWVSSIMTYGVPPTLP